MSKYTAIIFLGMLVIVLAVAGLPPLVRTSLLVLSGLGIAVLGYLSSVVYCSNCKKLIDEADQALPASPEDITTTS
ncbi:MAG: hypothetical protein A2937_01725 [Candidatus Yonathbacteria bacterium RIFCSPLOWO2_01_FULL_47_33b]|uniref:Uncharacterized protein n=1 Tax=Candidatus Yonathbacteria bacterium RIFCSPLOWO2_01_FULL_47_33b TaxID=1802727 RepID=A0A1G2SHL8_9BACT|nr:MAG: hypothetical protein A2937_01725 [Candidatus Yonathbacteria bacterium RIFCSPLOWO2_01_FULL_47_33b]